MSDPTDSSNRWPVYRIPSLFEIFFGRLANWVRKLARWRKQGLLRKALRAVRRKSMHMELIEPRILLSSDISYTAVGAADRTLRVDDINGTEMVRLVDSNDPSIEFAAEALANIDGSSGHGARIDANGFDVNLTIDDSVESAVIRGGVIFDAGAGFNSLLASNAHKTLNIIAEGMGNVRDLVFTGVERLVGGLGDDQFVLAGAAAGGAIHGGAGVNTLKAFDSDNSWIISGANAGRLNNHDFTDIQHLAGGSGSDSFAFTSQGNLSGSASGGAGDDTLTAADGVNAWEITRPNAGTLNAQTFSEIENLSAGAGVGSLFVLSEPLVRSGRVPHQFFLICNSRNLFREDHIRVSSARVRAGGRERG